MVVCKNAGVRFSDCGNIEVILLVCLFTREFRPVLSDCHISSTGESLKHVCRIYDVSLVVSAFISVKYDFHQRNTFLQIGLARVMVAVISRRIAARSLTPTTSSVRFESDGRFVKTKSRQFWSRPRSAFMFRKRSFRDLEYLTLYGVGLVASISQSI